MEMVVDVSLDVELPRDPGAPGRARRLIAELSVSALDGVELDRARVVVSELVSNAVLHGRGTITLRASLDPDRLSVEVIDEGGGFEPAMGGRSPDDPHGRGLMIVDTEASRWGLHDGATHVWFEIERTDSRRGADRHLVVDALA